MSEQNKIDEIKAYVELCEEEGYKFQHLDNLKFLLQEIERRDKALEWANRIIGNGLDTGAELRYEPQYWLLQYHEHMTAREAL
ncbi:hypothetical protein JCM10914A_56050 [Paenibacillus sp. JCM 10914]|uniref:hypothetical protein n=1 Tax=Paenibacillus sp. JCM 10914 TaxID=1236974 RepID=UPI0003CC4FFC|nr:hypothetical protein [Paenibacillus sp. JCM 10914]GAE09597.1 hypothetical protein JCM10914_5965 [Paenibacillus sp. JCM 10914]